MESRKAGQQRLTISYSFYGFAFEHTLNLALFSKLSTETICSPTYLKTSSQSCLLLMRSIVWIRAFKQKQAVQTFIRSLMLSSNSIMLQMYVFSDCWTKLQVVHENYLHFFLPFFGFPGTFTSPGIFAYY